MIAGLTTQRAVLPPTIGKLRKGGEGKAAKTKDGRDYKSYGDDLDHFRFTPRIEQDTQLTTDFTNAYGDQPQRIEVYLPSDEVDVVFDAWQEEWNASTLLHRCDGQFVYERNRYTGEYQPTNTPCPWIGKERTPKNPGCKQIGRLAVLLPELLNAGHYGVVTVETHSINDIANIHRALTDFRNRFGRLTGVPFYVYRYPENISTPSGSNGGRARREKWLVGITPATEFVQKQLEQARQLALGSDQPRALLVDNDGVIVDGESEVIEMITPDQWRDINTYGKEAYTNDWKTVAPKVIERVSNGRTTNHRELTHAEAQELLEVLESEADELNRHEADMEEAA